MIAGDPDFVAGEIVRTMVRLGVDVFLAIPSYGAGEQERTQRSIARFATDVLPRVRERFAA